MLNLNKIFNYPPRGKDIENREAKGLKTKIIIVLLVLLGISSLAEAQEKANSLSPEELQKLAKEAKEIMADSAFTKTNPRAFIEQRSQGTMENSWQEYIITGDSVVGGFTAQEIIGRPTESTCISNSAGTILIKEIITTKNSEESIKQKQGYCNYESNVLVMVDTNLDGRIDMTGLKWISNPGKNYEYQDIYEGFKTNDESRELNSFRYKIGSKFREDQVKSGAFYEAAKKAGIIWWINDDLTPEQKGALQLDYSNFLKDLVKKINQEKGN